jgi:hypothetical protein
MSRAQRRGDFQCRNCKLGATNMFQSWGELSQSKWSHPSFAASRLASHWDIPDFIAEQIVSGVMEAGKPGTVRGRRQYEPGLRDISEEISAIMRWRRAIDPTMRDPYSPDFADVEINWDHLLELGRNLVPTEYEHSVSAAIEKQREDAQSRTQHDPTARSEDTPAPKRRPGPAPELRVKIEKHMRKDIEQGARTADELRDMKQEALAATYKTSRHTACDALKNVLQETRTNSDNSDK